MELTPHAILAKEYFMQGYNCSQSIVLAFQDMTTFSKEDLLRLSAPFGGGMGRLREVCGAVSGMFMIAGILYARIEPGVEPKTENYARIQDLAARFKEETGSIVCRELLGLDHKIDPPVPEERTTAYYKKRPCVEMIALAACIMDQYIEEHPLAK